MKRILLVVLLFLPVMGAAESMYKWSDEKGIVHFSNTPPAEQMETELLEKQGPQLISNGQPPLQDSEGSSKPALTDNTSVQDSNLSKQSEKEAYCNSLRGNLSMLKNTPRLRIARASGEYEVLDNAGREKERARIQELFDQFCTN